MRMLLIAFSNWINRVIHPAPLNFNYTYNFGVYALISILCSLVYYSSLANSYFFFILTVSVTYVILYTWRKLKLSILSYMSFLINSFFFSLFSFGVYRLYIGFPTPIYLENLSLFSYYRYMAFLIITCVGICLYILLKYYPSMQPLITTISFPYLKEETRLILETWNDGFIGDICCKILNLLIGSRKHQLIFFITHFVLFYIIRIVQTLLFFNFVFLHGDLRWNIYLLPISFCIWLLRFLEHYFIIFFTASLQYLSDSLKVETKEGLFTLSNNFIIVKPKDLTYTITPFGISRGFTDGAIVFGEWLKYVQLQSFLVTYKSRVNFLSMSFVILNIICWSYILFLFNSSEHVSLVWPFLVRRSFSTSQRLLAPRHMRHIDESIQNQVKNATNNKHSPGHPVYGDWEDGSFLAEGSVSHGKPIGIQLTELGTQQGHSKPTNAIPYDKPLSIPAANMKPPIKGSEAFLNDPAIKGKLDKLHDKSSKED